MLTSEKKILLGFAGRAGVGKTTTANWLVENHAFKKLAFADPLKECLSVLTGYDINYFTHPERKEENLPGLEISTRVLMQRFATDFIRNMVMDDFWVWRMRLSLSEYSHRHIVIDDVRFENEAQLIRDNGGTIVHLIRDFEGGTAHTDHASERGVVPIHKDIIIDNVGDIFETADAVCNETFWE